MWVMLGTVSQDFWLQFFSRIMFPRFPLAPFRFFKNTQRYIFAAQGAPPVPKTVGHIFPEIYFDIGDTGGKCANGVSNSGSKLPPVSMTRVVRSAQDRNCRKNSLMIKDHYQLFTCIFIYVQYTIIVNAVRQTRECTRSRQKELFFTGEWARSCRY
jgi:hypothetical protein